MKKLTIIGGGVFQEKLIIKAKELNYETFVFAWEQDAVAKKISDHFFPISITEKEKILEECRLIRPDGICSVASDLAVKTVGFVARKLGLTSNSEFSDIVSTNKYEMRKLLSSIGLKQPLFKKVDTYYNKNTLKNFTFDTPVIIKPTDRSGSRGVTRIETKGNMIPSINRAIDLSFEKAAIIEEYIAGKEYSCECISYKGRHHLLSITEKYTTDAPHYVEIGHIEPAIMSNDMKQLIENTVFKALDALDIQYGASHTELKITEENIPVIIEIGARMGGDEIGAELVPLSTGLDYLKMVIDIATGYEPQINYSTVSSKPYAGIHFFMNPDEVNELRNIDDDIHIKYVSQISPGCNNIMDSGDRCGYVIFVSKNYNKLKHWVGTIR